VTEDCGPNKPNYYLANLGPLWHTRRPTSLAKTLENRPQQRAQESQQPNINTLRTIGHKSAGGKCKGGFARGFQRGASSTLG